MIEFSPMNADPEEPVTADCFASVTYRHQLDAALLEVFSSKSLRRSLKIQQKLNLPELGVRAFKEIETALRKPQSRSGLDDLSVHRRLVDGLPGQALFIAAALAFDTLNDALPNFEITAKTAWLKLDSVLSSSQSQQALRLGRAAIIAAKLMGSIDGGRRYLRSANFALGGLTALELLRTAEGEQLVLGELQTQAQGGPV